MPSPLQKWFEDRGDDTLRLDYPDLVPESLIFDIGGYKGEWVRSIFSKYASNVYVFEPIPDLALEISRYFAFNDKVKVFNCGFGAKNASTDIYFDDDGSSTIRKSSRPISIELRKISEFIIESDIKMIDLMKINVEGAEYAILADLYEMDLMRRVKKIQIQFHDFVDSPLDKLRRTREMLSKTHHQDWCYEFVWESWSLKETYRAE